MSSVVKKLKAFVPKIKKKTIKRNVPTTPQASQDPKALGSPVTEAESPVANASGLATPAATQVTLISQTTEMTITTSVSVHKASNELAIAESDEEHDDAYIAPPSRRTLTVLRRLLGIQSLHPRTGLIDQEKAAKAIASVPENLTPKARRALVTRTATPILPPRKEQTPVPEEEEDPTNKEPTPEAAIEGDYVLAVARDGILRKHKVVRDESGNVITEPSVAKAKTRKRTPKLSKEEKDLLQLGGEKVTGRIRFLKRILAQQQKERVRYEEIDEDDLGEPTPPPKRRKRATEGRLVFSNQPLEITSKSQLPRKVREEDEPLWAMVRLKEDVFPMKDLCKPKFPVGKVSEDYEKAKEAEKKRKEAIAKRRALREKAREQRKPLDVVIAEDEGEVPPESNLSSKSVLDQEIEEPRFQAPKLVIGSDGHLTVDADSMHVQRTQTDFSNRERHEENPFENPVLLSTYSKRQYTDKWTKDEVTQFYKALSTFGTDFTMIAQLFPYRTRKQIKLKFNLEEKKYPEVIEMALRRKLPPDFEQFCSELGLKIESMEYYNAQLAKVREDHAKHIETIERERQKALKEDQEASRKREIEFRTGTKAMTRKEKIKELRKNEMVIGEVGK